MTYLVAAVMVAALAALVAYPFWAQAESEPVRESNDSRELFKREKDVALLAIREAELDRAMGKLSDEDYGTLRGQYERRAIKAIAALDDLEASPPPTVLAGGGSRADGVANAHFCSSCGHRFQAGDRFCRACGCKRSRLT